MLLLSLVLGRARPADGQEPARLWPFASRTTTAFAPATSDTTDPDACPYPFGPCTCEAGGGLFARLRSPLSTAEDDDGPINTDRPSFTPSSATVPRGRVQFESGYTFSHDLTSTTRNDQHGFPELATRVGLTDWLELRTYWNGQTYSRTTSRPDGRLSRSVNGTSDLVAGFKWQLLKGEGWAPKTALITSLQIPTRGGSPFSSRGVDPLLFLVYSWSVTDRFTLAGSTGLTIASDRGVTSLSPTFDGYEQYSQSLIGFFSAADDLTLYYEWYVLSRTNSASKLPQHSMDGGVLYLLTPNIQLDLRAGFGLNDSSTDFFTGAGLSFRF